MGQQQWDGERDPVGKNLNDHGASRCEAGCAEPDKGGAATAATAWWLIRRSPKPDCRAPSRTCLQRLPSSECAWQELQF